MKKSIDFTIIVLDIIFSMNICSGTGVSKKLLYKLMSKHVKLG